MSWNCFSGELLVSLFEISALSSQIFALLDWFYIEYLKIWYWQQNALKVSYRATQKIFYRTFDSLAVGHYVSSYWENQCDLNWCKTMQKFMMKIWKILNMYTKMFFQRIQCNGSTKWLVFLQYLWDFILKFQFNLICTMSLPGWVLCGCLEEINNKKSTSDSIKCRLQNENYEFLI